MVALALWPLLLTHAQADPTFNLRDLDSKIYSRWFSTSLEETEYISQDKNHASLYALHNGRVMARVSKLNLAWKYILNGEFKKFYGSLSHSPSFAIPLTSDIITDLTASYQARQLTGKRIANRIQFCTLNLSTALTKKSFTELLNPANHIAFLIDGQVETVDPMATAPLYRNLSAALCTPIVIHNPLQERLIIEKLMCINRIYREKFKYNFLRNNCGGFTYDIGEMSGLIPIGIPNLGVGSHFFRPSEDLIEPFKNEVLTECENHINDVFQTLNSASLNGNVKSFNILTPKKKAYISPDLTMEFISALIRHKNYKRLIELVEPLNVDYYLGQVYFTSQNQSSTKQNATLVVKPEFKNFIRDLFSKDIEWESLNYKLANTKTLAILKVIQNEVQNDQ